MIQIPLDAIPNQSLSIRLDNHFYNIIIKSPLNVPCATIVRDNVEIISNFRIVGGSLILPYRYLENNAGNFILLTSNEDLPEYTKFGISQTLLFISDSELGAFRA